MKIENTTRGEIFWMDANDPRLVVVTDKQHRLYDSRVQLPVAQAMVASISDPKIGIRRDAFDRPLLPMTIALDCGSLQSDQAEAREESSEFD